MSTGESVHRFFVDEAGDLTLFDRNGAIVVGQTGISQLFMVGVAYLPKPVLAQEYMESLRADLLADPYFQGVPSFEPQRGKTAVCFHACKDPPEVRYHVFKLLPRLGARIRVAIRRKAQLAGQYKARFERGGRKFRPDDIYDDLVKRLFKDVLHKADRNEILFARRGKANRYHALRGAIAAAKRNFEATHGKPSDRPTDVRSAVPHEHAGLQVIDYYMWALQRLFERGEDRFFRLLAPAYRLIMDLDDTRNKPYGEWYSDDNPLDLRRIMPVAS